VSATHISAASLRRDPFTQPHVTDGTETLRINGGKPLACLTGVQRDLAGTNEIQSHCQISKGVRLYCCYRHNSSWRGKEIEPLWTTEISIYSAPHSLPVCGAPSFQALWGRQSFVLAAAV